MIIPERVNKHGNTVPAFQVDDCFAEEVKRWKWFEQGRGYLMRWTPEGERELLHRYIWKLSGRDPVKMLDHVNGDPLDNRLENLRPATSLLNTKNKRIRRKTVLPQGVKVISSGRFSSSVTHRRKRHHLGTYDTPEEASAAYENAREMLIEFANLPGYEEVIRCQR